MFWDKKLRRWAEAVRARADLPARLVLWNGEQFDFGRFEQPRVTLTVRSASALPLLLDPSLDHLGEAYEGPDRHRRPPARHHRLRLCAGARMSKTQGAGKGPGRWRLRRARQGASGTAAARTANPSSTTTTCPTTSTASGWTRAQVYSCAYFENGDEDLATAQRKKLDHILTKIRLQPGQRLLDIGCGWGALVLRAAQHFAHARA
jgi:cyclopropane-fatty-acyl-phospholipid synthase